MMPVCLCACVHCMWRLTREGLSRPLNCQREVGTFTHVMLVWGGVDPLRQSCCSPYPGDATTVLIVRAVWPTLGCAGMFCRGWAGHVEHQTTVFERVSGVHAETVRDGRPRPVAELDVQAVVSARRPTVCLSRGLTTTHKRSCFSSPTIRTSWTLRD